MMVVTVECWYQIPWYFNLRKNRYCSKLKWYFYNTGQKYHSILILEKGGTKVNYHSIFITLAPGLICLSTEYPYTVMCSICTKVLKSDYIRFVYEYVIDGKPDPGVPSNTDTKAIVFDKFCKSFLVLALNTFLTLIVQNNKLEYLSPVFLQIQNICFFVRV